MRNRVQTAAAAVSTVAFAVVAVLALAPLFAADASATTTSSSSSSSSTTTTPTSSSTVSTTSTTSTSSTSTSSTSTSSTTSTTTPGTTTTTTPPGERKPQVITWQPDPAGRYAEGTPLTVTAVATSSLPVTITVTSGSPDNCRTTGATSPIAVQLIHEGTCTFRASQAGDTTWLPAADITTTITITARVLVGNVITLHAPPRVFQHQLFNVDARATSDLPVAITVTGNCTGRGSSSFVALGQNGSPVPLTSTVIGTCTVHANEPGNTTFPAAVEVTAVVQVVQAEYVAVTPLRILETRSQAPYTQIGYSGAKPTRGQVITVHVTAPGTPELDANGRPQVPGTAKAVVVNLTAADADAAGYVTVWDCSAPRPLASSLNVKSRSDSLNETPNLVVADLAPDGTFCVYADVGTNLVADLNGYFPLEASYVPVKPDRLLETRNEPQIGYSGAKPTAGQTVTVQVTGRDNVPVGAVAAVVNVTATNIDAAGGLTIWDCSATVPSTPNITLIAGSTIPRTVVADLSPQTNGTMCIRTTTGTDLVVDLDGYYPPDSGYRPLPTTLALDTAASGQRFGADESRRVGVVGASGVPAGDASAVVLTVRGSGADFPGFVTVWDCTEPRPNASNVNLATASSTTNLVLAKLSSANDVCVFSQAPADIQIAVVGYFGPLARV